ncbi:MAG: hypothetical protein WC503_02275 [Candidatus Shapirobacteria bacterium]
MFFLGFISFLQIIFLPGWLVLSIFKLKCSNLLEKFIFSFALSWWLNYLLVTFLTSFGLYTKPVVIIVVIFELILFFIIHKKSNFKKISLNFLTNCFKNRTNTIILIPVLTVLVIYFILLVNNFLELSIFSAWDAVVSWNRWATDWSQNIFPRLTREYPQLIPSNWSLGYVIMGTSIIQFWNRLSILLFPINIASIFVLIALKKKKYLYLLGVPIFHLSLIYFYDFSFATDGYVDVALAFYSFLSFYVFFINHQQKYLLSLLFASAAAMSKQFGVLFYGLISIINVKRIFKNSHSFFYWILLSLITMGWYFYKQFQFASGADASNLDTLLSETAIVQSLGTNTNIFPKFFFGLKRLFGIYIEQQILFVFLVFLAIYACRQKEARAILGFFVLPFFLIWSIWFSYNKMNFFIAIPFLIFCSLLGFDILMTHTKHQKIKYHLLLTTSLLFTFTILLNNYQVIKPSWPIYLIVFNLVVLFFHHLRKHTLPALPLLGALFVFIYLIGKFYLTDTILLSNQIQQQRALGNPELNKIIYKYNQNIGLRGKIITNYQYLCFLPELKEHCLIYSLPLSIDEAIKNKASYILSNNTMLTPKTIEIVNNNIKEGLFNQIFSYQGLRLIQID